MENLNKNGLKQLCWKCAKACNLNACIWVKTLKRKPKGVKLDKQGHIIYCPNFEKDNGIYTKKEYVKRLGVTEEEYKKIIYAVLELLKKGITATIIECIRFMRETGFTSKDYASIKRCLNKNNLGYIPFDYIHKTIKKQNITIYDFVKECNKEYKPTKQEEKNLSEFLQREELKALEREETRAKQMAKQHEFFKNNLGSDTTQIKVINTKKDFDIKVYLTKLNISKDTCKKIKRSIWYYKKQGIVTTFEECIRFLYKTNLHYQMFFYLKKDLFLRGIKESPEDYYIKTFILNNIRQDTKEIEREIKEKIKIPRKKTTRVFISKVKEFCERQNITEDIYIRIKYCKKDHRKKGIITTHEECLNFMQTTGASYKDYFLVKRVLHKKGLECSPVDYYNNNLEELKELKINNRCKGIGKSGTIKEICKKLDIEPSLYHKIMCSIRDYKKQGIETSLEECVNYIKKTNLTHKDYFLEKRNLHKKGLKILFR